MAKLTAKKLVDFCKSAANANGEIEKTFKAGVIGYKGRWGYVYGAQGERYTDELAKKWAGYRPVPAGRGTRKEYFLADCSQWLGRTVTDCSGMIIAAIRTVSPAYGDKNAATLINTCSKKGSMSNMPEVAGLCVWKAGHIGVYIGDGWVIEARGTDYGVVKSKLSTQAWKKWGYLEGIDYGDASEWEVNRVLKLASPMMRGDDVKELQKRIADYGLKKVLVNGEAKSVEADGVFGAITEAAVKAYQKSKGLTVDGKAGKNTITALGGKWR